LERKDIFHAIELERERQEKIHPLPSVRNHHDPEIMAMQKYIQTQELLAVLIEEVGEVGRALQGESNLEEELIHVASVCIRWLEIKDPVD
jgi:hypothetical protein